MTGIRQYLDILNEVGEDETSKPATIYVTSRVDDKYLGLIAKNPNEYNTQEAKQVHEDALEVLTKYSQYISGGESTVNELNDKQFRFNGLLVDELEAARKRAEARRDDPAAAELQETIYGYVHYAKTANQWDGEPPVKSEEIDELLTVMFGEQYYFMSKEDIATRLEQEKSMFRSIELTNAPMNDEMKVQKEIVDRLDAIVSDNNQRLIWSEVGQQLDTDLGDDDPELETGTTDTVAPGRPTTDDGAPNDMGDEPPTGSSGPTGSGEGTTPFRPNVDVDADQDFDGDPEDFGPGGTGTGRGDGSSEVGRRTGDASDETGVVGGTGTGTAPSYNVDADQDFYGDADGFGPGTGGTGRGSGSSEVSRRATDGATGTGRGSGTGEVSRRATDGATGTGRGSGTGEVSRRATDSVTGTGRSDGEAEVSRREKDSTPPPPTPKPRPAAQPKYYPGVTEPDYRKSLRIAQQALKQAQDKLAQGNLSNLDKVQARGNVQVQNQKIKMYKDHLLATPRTERGKLIHHRNMLNRSAVASGQAGDQKTRAGYKKQAAQVSQQLKTVKESAQINLKNYINKL